MRRGIRQLAVAAALGLAGATAITSGCQGERPAAESGASSPPERSSPREVIEGSASVPSSEWTVGTLSAPPTGSAATAAAGLPLVAELRTGRHAGYDRVTVELDRADGVPGYRLQYVDRPLHECGSGRQVHPVGDAWLELRLEPASAHTPAGESTLSGTEIPVDGAVVGRIYRTCDFEAVVVLVLAVSSPEPFRVLTLSDPARIAVDVRQ